MADKFIIEDTILFTAGIKNLRTGAVYTPASITVSVFKKSGECLLDKKNATIVTGEDYNYLYEWKIIGTVASPLVEASDLIVVWDWSGPHKKRLVFKVIPQV